MMRERGRLVACLTLMVAFSAPAGAEEAERTTIIKRGAGGLDVTVVYGSEEKTYNDQEKWVFATDAITFTLEPEEEYSVKELEDAGRIYTSITSEGSCFTLERLAGEAAPTLEVATSSEGTELLLTMNSGSCGGCVTVWNRTNFNASEEPWLGCPDPLFGAVCTYCISGPCPEPEPEPDPDPWPDRCLVDPLGPGCLTEIELW